MNWDEYFFQMAELVSTKSKDPSTKVGVVVVGPDHEIRSTGFNGFPRGVNELDEKRWERPIKYEFVEHAERNSVHNAARVGVSLKGCTMYMNGDPYPCVECTKAVIQAGIVEIRGWNRPFTKNKDWHFDTSKIMLEEAGVKTLIIGRANATS